MCSWEGNHRSAVERDAYRLTSLCKGDEQLTYSRARNIVPHVLLLGHIVDNSIEENSSIYFLIQMR